MRYIRGFRDGAAAAALAQLLAAEVDPERDAVDQRDRYASANPADLDLDPLTIKECRDSNRYGEAHRSGRDRCGALGQLRLRI